MEYEDIKTLPYLEACINEALRMHSTSSMGLPRVMPAQGAEFQGEFFREGTEVSVPAYTIHVSRNSAPLFWRYPCTSFRGRH